MGHEWLASVRLFRVPAINSRSYPSLDFWPDRKLVTDLPEPMLLATPSQTFALRESLSVIALNPKSWFTRQVLEPT